MRYPPGLRVFNNAGEIVGYYKDSSSALHGFLQAAGTFSTIDFPGAAKTQCFGINSSGQIVGAHVDSFEHGFVYSGGSFTSIDYPNQPTNYTSALGINNSGEIVGIWEGPPAVPVALGFVDAGGTFTSIIYPNTYTTTAIGINDAGEIVGSAFSDPLKPAIGFLAVPVTTATVSPTAIDFGDQLVGATSSERVATVTNTGAASRYVGSVATSVETGPSAYTSGSDEFGFAPSNTCSAGILPGGTCTFSVTFTPAAIGVANGYLSMVGNAPFQGDLSLPGVAAIDLTGNGTGPVVSLSPSSLTFPAQVVESSVGAQPVTLRNMGDASLAISGIRTSADFSQTNTCGMAVSVGGQLHNLRDFQAPSGRDEDRYFEYFRQCRQEPPKRRAQRDGSRFHSHYTFGILRFC